MIGDERDDVLLIIDDEHALAACGRAHVVTG
jgi:hypothetical protein